MPTARGGTVCIVDDDASVCDSLSAMLTAYGFRTRAYQSGSDYLADDRHGEASCLIIDQHMPDTAGLDIVESLRRAGLATRVVLITGRIDDAIVERARRLGVARVLEKPFSPLRLVNLLSTGMDGEGAPAV